MVEGGVEAASGLFGGRLGAFCGASGTGGLFGSIDEKTSLRAIDDLDLSSFCIPLFHVDFGFSGLGFSSVVTGDCVHD